MSYKNIYTYLNTLQQKGFMAYEYNPFHNYQTNVDLYKCETDVGEVLVPKNCIVNKHTGIIFKKVQKGNDIYYIDEFKNVVNNPDNNYITQLDNLYAKAGSLIDFETNKLNFDLEHPVDIEVQPSYDGSVNLILNDDKNIPRLINSRFSTREKNTYEIVDRIGENDTNIYSSDDFDKDTSLYFQYGRNPVIKYKEFIKGVLPVGQYCFYITYCDSDDNESDYIAESSLIPVFIGSDRDPYSIDGGIKNQSSNKGIKLEITNLDKSYNYLRIYYVRYFADYQQNRVYECKKFLRRTAINSSTIYIQITGQEDVESLDPNILNITRFNPKHVLTQAQCKNMLFFGNIVKNTDNYKELSDCALRICPELVVDNSFKSTDINFYVKNPGYYDSQNMTQKVGYFNKEYYRFGVVFIYNNGTLSNVYNTLGCELKSDSKDYYNGQVFTEDGALLKRNYIKVDDKGWIIKTKEKANQGIAESSVYDDKISYLNARGVCKLNYSDANYNDDTIFGVHFNIPTDVKQYLKEDLGIRGLFFVRQKCIPNILGQCLLLPMDEVMDGPVIEFNGGITECFVTKDRKVENAYLNRIYEYNLESGGSNISENAYAAICPDFLLNQPYYNQIFNSSKFKLRKIKNNSTLIRKNLGDRYYFYDNESIVDEGAPLDVTICSVTENVPSVAIKDKTYKLNMGECEESFRFKYANVDNGAYDEGKPDKVKVDGKNVTVKERVNRATNLVRGTFSPYLAIYSEQKLETCCLYNIYQEHRLDDVNEFQVRMDSSEPFYAISDRYNFEDIPNNLQCWRGDCYINNFAYRVFRNFNDPSLPNNDVIIEPNTWKDNYDITNPEKWADIYRSDLNAVQMGSWILFKVRSAQNYALRSEDHSYVSEEALMGSPRSFYPRRQMMWKGQHKLPDSYLYNDAYRATLGYKCYFTLQDVNYIKDNFSNRIQYSAMAIQDSYKNNYRYSLSTYFRDYSMEYGSITRLIGFEGYLLVVFEHAIAVAVINERVLAGQSDGEPVFINTANVLPEELTVISDTIGSQWSESIIKSEAGYVYGVDTIAKKIWRVKGQQLDIISDMKVNKFLVDNITLSERELNPFIGLKNVKSHYNNNKKDILFTFYDDVNKDEEKVWNLCYNELMGETGGEFITFYSWVPSYSENIDTQFFTFDRNTSKEIALLSKCTYCNPENHGVLLNPIFTINDSYQLTNDSQELYYRFNVPISVKEFNAGQQQSVKDVKEEKTLKHPDVTFELLKDHWKNNEYFTINNNGYLQFKQGVDIKDLYDKMVDENRKTLILYIKPSIGSDYNIIDKTHSVIEYPIETVAVTFDKFVKNTIDYTEALTTDFYLHGQSGIIDIKENIYPCYWYGKQHPFEFEFVINDKIGQQKIFTDLVLISNKAEPESFHFEIEGDNYEFSSDKRTMYYRQERTKEQLQDDGHDILYNLKYRDVAADRYTFEQYYRGDGKSPYDDTVNNKYTDYKDYYNKHYGFDKVYPMESKNLVKQVKSTIFPMYYNRIDTYNEIYDNYQLITGDNVDYQNLSGSEVSWNRDLNQFNVITHIKNSPIDKVGRLRGNSHYKEGRWSVQIPSINYRQNNETTWDVEKELFIPPIIQNNIVTNEYQIGQGWTYRKETKIRDKWMKVKVRYSGRNLAIIHSIITLYNVSYA